MNKKIAWRNCKILKFQNSPVKFWEIPKFQNSSKNPVNFLEIPIVSSLLAFWTFGISKKMTGCLWNFGILEHCKVGPRGRG